MRKLYRHLLLNARDIGMQTHSEEDVAAMMEPTLNEYDAALVSFARLVAELLEDEPPKLDFPQNETDSLFYLRDPRC